MNPKSILATLAEIEVNPFRALFDEKQEALAIIERIEKGLKNGEQAEATRQEDRHQAEGR
jgi:hypothetical protein